MTLWLQSTRYSGESSTRRTMEAIVSADNTCSASTPSVTGFEHFRLKERLLRSNANRNLNDLHGRRADRLLYGL